MYYFQVTEKPKMATMNIDAVEVVLGQKYEFDLDTIPAISIVNETPYLGEPFDSFKYKVYKDDIASVNTGIVTINYKVDTSEIPATNILVKDVYEGDYFYFSDLVANNSHYDRIKITEISGRGIWLYNGLQLSEGAIIFYYNLVDNLQFIANDNGLELNYSMLKWETGNVSGFDGVENSITVNTISDGAELELTSFAEIATVTDGIEYLSYSFKISKAFVDALYQIEIDPTLFPGLGVNPLDKIIFLERDLPEYVLTTNAVTDRDSQLDGKGQTIYSVTIEKNTVTTETNSISIELKSITGSPGVINIDKKTIVLIIPITPTP